MRLPRVVKTSIFRLTALYVLLFTLSVGVLFAVVFVATQRALRAEIETAVEREAVSLADDYRLAGALRAAVLIDQRLRRGALSYYLLQDGAGGGIAGNIAPVAPRPGPLDLAVQVQNGESGPIVTHEAIGYGVVLSNGAFVLVGDDASRVGAATRAIRSAFLLAGGASLVLAISGGLLLGSSFLRRLESVNDTARAIMAGRLDSRVPVTGADDELDRLSANLNAMLDRIGALMGSLRQVSTDIAHDLRTPLSRLRQRLEQGRAEATTVEAFRAVTDGAIAESDALLETFSALLRIAQIEAGHRRAAFAAIDLSALCRSVAETFAPVAEEGGRTLGTDITPDVAITGDRELLLQLLANLVENALTHTPPGARITLALERADAGARLTVTDDGPGVPAEEREKVLARFYRLDRSRSTPGSGLGLALVAAIADLHEARLTLEDAAPGLRVSIAFPNVR